MSRHKISLDFETYCDLDLQKVGAFKYVEHDSFEALLLCLCLDDEEPVQYDFTAGEVLPERWVSMLKSPDYIKTAVNSNFEITVLCKLFGFSHRDLVNWIWQWRDTAFNALYCGLPRSLKGMTDALDLPQDQKKLRTGKALIQYFCKPCSPTKANGGRIRNMPTDAPEKWALFKEYNKQDVVAEMAVDKSVEEWPPPQWLYQQWCLDQIQQARGIQIDAAMVSGALELMSIAGEHANEELTKLTGLENPNSRDQLLAWVNDRLSDKLSDLKKETVSEALDSDRLPADVRWALDLRVLSSKTSNEKFQVMDKARCNDGRIRGTLLFYGANRSGRWAGRLLQVQNFPKSFIKDLDFTKQLITEADYESLKVIYGNVTDTLSQMLRCAMVPAANKMFIDCDFSAIEARVLAWMAGEEWVLNVFRGDGKIYESTYAQAFNVPPESVGKHSPERQQGKVMVLACGYGGSEGAMARMDFGHEIDPALYKPLVNRWREANPHIVQFWYDFGNAAMEVVKHGGSKTVRMFTLALEGDPRKSIWFLTIKLPSGRKLFYMKPSIGKNRFGGDAVNYYGQDQTSGRWSKIDTWGGKLAENVTQAVARDLLAEKIVDMEQAGLPVVFSIHDEAVCEVPADEAHEAFEKMRRIMGSPVSWAEGLPLVAEGWIDNKFKKD